MIREDTEQINISWLSEYDYCPKRFYLKVIEQINGFNEYIAEGISDHHAVNVPKTERRKNLIRVMSMPVYSKQYNLYGICDCVEFIEDITRARIPGIGDTYMLINASVLEIRNLVKQKWFLYNQAER